MLSSLLFALPFLEVVALVLFTSTFAWDERVEVCCSYTPFDIACVDDMLLAGLLFLCANILSSCDGMLVEDVVLIMLLLLL